MPSHLEFLRAPLEVAAAQLRLHVSGAEVESLITFVELLQRWNTVYNLTSVRDPAAMVTQHLADCLAVVAPLRRHLGGKSTRLLDVGSGAGLPGIVLAITNPTLSVTCIDAVGKKAAFVQQVQAQLQLPNLKGVHVRAEAFAGPQAEIISSRAFSSLSDLVRLTESHLASGGSWMAMKGRLPTAEIQALPTTIEVFHVEQLTVPGLDARCLVWMRRSTST